jgi:hypothetical protein
MLYQLSYASLSVAYGLAVTIDNAAITCPIILSTNLSGTPIRQTSCQRMPQIMTSAVNQRGVYYAADI